MLMRPRGWPSEKSPYYFDPVLRWATWLFAGVLFLLALSLLFVANHPRENKMLLYFVIAMLVSTIIQIPYGRRWKRLIRWIKSGLCPYCGYDRRGTEREAECPECGGEHPHLKDGFRPRTNDRE